MSSEPRPVRPTLCSAGRFLWVLLSPRSAGRFARPVLSWYNNCPTTTGTYPPAPRMRSPVVLQLGPGSSSHLGCRRISRWTMGCGASKEALEGGGLPEGDGTKNDNFSAADHQPIKTTAPTPAVKVDGVQAKPPESRPPDGNRRIERLADRSPTVEAIVAFTDKYDLWNRTTAEVIKRVIVPKTTGSNVNYRFAELAEMEKACGPAEVFVSHSWSSSWGAIVSVLVSHYGPTTHAFVDIFANLQYSQGMPDSEAAASLRAELANDLAVLDQAIRSCSLGTVVVVDAPRAVAAKEANPFKRLWCRWEMWVTVHEGRLLTVALGSVEPRSRAFVHDDDNERFKKLHEGVDFRDCDATIEADKAKIFSEVEKSTVTFDEVDRVTQISLSTCIMRRRLPAFAAAIAGDRAAVREHMHALDDENWRGKAVHYLAASRGQHAALRLILEEGADPKEANNWGFTPLHYAALQNDIESVKVLLSFGADPTATTAGDGKTPAELAKDETTKALLLGKTS